MRPYILGNPAKQLVPRVRVFTCRRRDKNELVNYLEFSLKAKASARPWEVAASSMDSVKVGRSVYRNQRSHDPHPPPGAFAAHAESIWKLGPLGPRYRGPVLSWAGAACRQPASTPDSDAQ